MQIISEDDGTAIIAGHKVKFIAGYEDGLYVNVWVYDKCIVETGASIQEALTNAENWLLNNEDWARPCE